jgi:hypothetical protein
MLLLWLLLLLQRGRCVGSRCRTESTTSITGSRRATAAAADAAAGASGVTCLLLCLQQQQRSQLCGRQHKLLAACILQAIRTQP